MREMKPVGPLTVAVIVDDEELRTAAAGALAAEGYEVRAFASGPHALTALGSGQAPHLLVVGLERRAAQLLREAQRRDLSLTSVPFLALLAGVDADAQLPRPLDLARLAELARALTTRSVAPPDGDPLDELAARLRFMVAQYPELAARMRELALRAGVLPRVEPHLARARRGVERLALIAEQLERFGRAEPEQPTEVDLARVVAFVLDLCADEIKYHAILVKQLNPTPRVRGDERQLAQVFFNLVVNAAQAIPEGKPAKNRIEVVSATNPHGWAIVEIRDTGMGIPEDILPRIFDPFFSTKRAEGSGVGLALCQSTVSRLGGSLSVHSEVGRGSSFRVALPPAERARG
jgi:signal transduction histidine kinase